MLHRLRFLAAPVVATSIATLATLATTVAPAAAQDQTLKVGSAAPGLTIDWVGDKIDAPSDVQLASRRTFVIEFWATWCGPCMKSIPHLNELHQKYRRKGLEIIGISDEPMSTVKPFVAKKGDGMSYQVAVDSEKKTYGAWMEAAKQNGIPCAFVVRDGKIQWIGNPLDPAFDGVVTGVLSGRYNPTLTRQAQPMLKAASDAARIKNFKDAYKHLDDVIALDPKVFGDVAVRKYKTMLVDAKDAEGAKAWGRKVASDYAQDPVTMSELVTLILTDDDVATRDYELAETLANAVRRAAPGAESDALLAQVYFEMGRLNDASERQYEAWMASSPEDKADFKRVLDKYKKAQKEKPKAAPTVSE